MQNGWLTLPHCVIKKKIYIYNKNVFRKLIGYMCLMLCAPLDWQYAELPSSASDAVLCSVLVRKMWDI